ncbi:hypothetical protein BDF19DRAFT_445012 [Syncephalis fuscata]|nr:hypothetical protein BDF19DRAFT_445012 [Syncephalis fuscata]
MLVSVTQVTPANGMPGLFGTKPDPVPDATEFMNIKLDGETDPFAIYDLKLIGKESNIRGVHYIDGMQRKDPIQLACGSTSNTKTTPFKYTRQDLLKSKFFEIMLPKGQFILPGHVKCYILPYKKCDPQYNPVSKNFGDYSNFSISLMGAQIDYLHKRCARYYKKNGWYANGDYENICFTGKKDDYKVFFTKFDNTISLEKLIELQRKMDIYMGLKEIKNKWRYNWSNIRTEEPSWKVAALEGNTYQLESFNDLLLPLRENSKFYKESIFV